MVEVKMGENTNRNKEEAINSFALRTVKAVSGTPTFGDTFKNFRAVLLGTDYIIRYTNGHGKRGHETVRAKNMETAKKVFRYRNKAATKITIKQRYPGERKYAVYATRKTQQELRREEMLRKGLISR